MRVLTRTPVSHYRVPICAKRVVDSIIEPATVDNEEEGFGRNAGNRGQEPWRSRGTIYRSLSIAAFGKQRS